MSSSSLLSFFNQGQLVYLENEKKICLVYSVTHYPKTNYQEEQTHYVVIKEYKPSENLPFDQSQNPYVIRVAYPKTQHEEIDMHHNQHVCQPLLFFEKNQEGACPFETETCLKFDLLQIRIIHVGHIRSFSPNLKLSKKSLSFLQSVIFDRFVIFKESLPESLPIKPFDVFQWKSFPNVVIPKTKKKTYIRDIQFGLCIGLLKSDLQHQEDNSALTHLLCVPITNFCFPCLENNSDQIQIPSPHHVAKQQMKLAFLDKAPQVTQFIKLRTGFQCLPYSHEIQKVGEIHPNSKHTVVQSFSGHYLNQLLSSEHDDLWCSCFHAVAPCLHTKLEKNLTTGSGFIKDEACESNCKEPCCVNLHDYCWDCESDKCDCCRFGFLPLEECEPDSEQNYYNISTDYYECGGNGSGCSSSFEEYKQNSGIESKDINTTIIEVLNEDASRLVLESACQNGPNVSLHSEPVKGIDWDPDRIARVEEMHRLMENFNKNKIYAAPPPTLAKYCIPSIVESCMSEEETDNLLKTKLVSI